VKFKSSGDLKTVEVWLTPSLDAVTASPASFATITKDTIYSITLSIANKPSHTLGGTLHLRDGSSTSRSYASPFPINVKVEGGSSSSSGGTQSGQQGGATVNGVAASADYKTGSATPGQAMSIFGEGIGPDDPASGKLDEHGNLSKYAGDVEVLFNGFPAPILMAGKNQINVLVPSGIAGDKTVDIVVVFKGKVSQTTSIPVQPTAPALFTIGGTGTGQAAAINQNGEVNSPLSKVRRGEVITLFGSGFGEWKENLPDGAVVGTLLPTPKAEVSVTIAGIPAKILYAGGAPGMVTAVVQINVEIPLPIIPGERVQLLVKAGEATSPGGVTIAIQ
jgi:uncharacterized protein (TIGR03437 family)